MNCISKCTPEPYQWHWTVDILSMFEIRMLINWHFPTTDSVRSNFVIKIACAQYLKCVNLATFLPYFSLELYRHTAWWTKRNNNCKFTKWHNKNLQPLENKTFLSLPFTGTSDSEITFTHGIPHQSKNIQPLQFWVSTRRNELNFDFELNFYGNTSNNQIRLNLASIFIVTCSLNN